jgi:uncharacterized protein (TIGR02217 family)
MSSAVFPSLIGLMWDVKRTAMWDPGSRVQESASGKETAVAYWSYPRYQWELAFEYLPSTASQPDFQSLLGFFNSRKASFDSFLYADATDNAATGSQLGLGDGVTTAFQLNKSLGGFTEPVLAPNVVSSVKLAGVTQAGANYSVSTWGAASPGVVTFVTAPGAGVAVTADLSFYYPCRFVDNNVDYSNFMSTLWEAKSVKYKSIK